MTEGKKVTLRVLADECRNANTTILKDLSWGLRVDQVKLDGKYHYYLKVVSRKEVSKESTLTNGTPREIQVALAAVLVLITLERSKQS